MEEENSSLPDITDSAPLQPQQDHQCINGEQEAIVWKEVQMNKEHWPEQLSLPTKGEEETPEDDEQWGQVIWPVHPMTCTTAPLPFATVQWDMPDTASETPSVSSANTLDSGSLMSLDTTSLFLHHPDDVHAELFMQEGRKEQDLCLFLNPAPELTENVSEACDAADIQELLIQEEDGSTHEQLNSNNEVPLRTDSEDKEPHSTLGCLIDIFEEAEGPEDAPDSPVDLRLEEEEPGVLLSGETEEEPTSVNGVQTEEEGEEEEVTSLSCTEESEDSDTCLSDAEGPVEPQPTVNTTIDASELVHLRQSETLEESHHTENEEELPENLTGQRELEPEMCKNIVQNVDPEQSKTARQQGDNEELSVQEADTKRGETSQELTQKQELTGCSGLQDCDQNRLEDKELLAQPEYPEQSEQIQAENCENLVEFQLQHREESAEMELFVQPRDRREDSTPMEQTSYVEEPGVAKQNGQALPMTSSSQQALSEQHVALQKTDESEMIAQLSPEADVTWQTAKLNQVERSHQVEEVGRTESGPLQMVVENGEQSRGSETVMPHLNGGDVEREMACRLAERLFKLDGIQRVDVVKHLDKDNDFSRAVGEEYLRFFDFTDQTLDHALRSFLKVVILIGETQERERVLQHFTCRFHQCNPGTFSSSGAALALTCALMLLNTDLHGQNVGKSMSSSKFVSNLEGMNEGENFSKELLKSLYNSIKSEPLQWAVDEEELRSTVLSADEAPGEEASLRSKSNPFQDVPHDKTAQVVKQGFLQRKLHADIDRKRTPWGKRGWKTFYGVLKGMVLYLQKADCRREQQTNEEVVSVHHSLAEQAAEYTKKPHVFRLQTADWRVFLFQASSKMEMNSWISRINLVSALHSAPPFPAAVGSQRRFCRPILPASQSTHTLESQLQFHAGMLESFKADLLYLQQNPPEGKKAKAKDLEEHRVRAEYLQHEMCRYETYIQVLEACRRVKKTRALSNTDLNLFDKDMCAECIGEEDEVEGGLKKSHSSPSLELEMAPPTVIKVKRNISERRTYRRPIVPRWNKEP
ncbi:uncharacterized protein ACBR49_014880 isoform 2-T5 [Aulostomus maculatus]